MTEDFEIFWRDNEIGKIEDGHPDMWYLEGKWISNGSEASKEFEKLVLTFDAKITINDLSKGTRVILKEDESETHAVIIALSEGNLFLRRVMDAKAIEWIIANVK